ncbi:unnamed protein product, partial [Prorocentrum cordatum]
KRPTGRARAPRRASRGEAARAVAGPPLAMEAAVPARPGPALGEITLQDLPPLPKPDAGKMRSEVRTGCAVVSGVIFLCVGAAHLADFAFSEDIPRPASWTIMVLVYVEAVLAVGLLCGVVFGDPGVVKRSAEACFPLPTEVAERLRGGQSTDGLANIRDGDRSFCVRCLVWRSPDVVPALGAPVRARGRRPHHCKTCERCVLHFDHHCAVLGRCIAGRGYFNGNMCYFGGLIAMGGLGALTAVSAVLAGLLHWCDSVECYSLSAVGACLCMCCCPRCKLPLRRGGRL